MRAYKKTTQHPYCVYLTAAEAEELIDEAVAISNADWLNGDDDAHPVIGTLSAKLSAVLRSGFEVTRA